MQIRMRPRELLRRQRSYIPTNNEVLQNSKTGLSVESAETIYSWSERICGTSPPRKGDEEFFHVVEPTGNHFHFHSIINGPRYPFDQIKNQHVRAIVIERKWRYRVEETKDTLMFPGFSNAAIDVTDNATLSIYHPFYSI